MKKSKSSAGKAPAGKKKTGETKGKPKPKVKASKAKPPKKAVASKAVKAEAAKKSPAKPVAKASAQKAETAKKTIPAKSADKPESKKGGSPAKTPVKEAPAAKTGKTKTDPKTKGAKTAPVSQDALPALDADVKRPAKPFFMEVKPGVERVIKRGDKSAISQVIDLQARRKGPATEETPEELAERIERELQSQSFLKRTPMRRQMCTKCGINVVTPRFTIDRELGYCETCAEILRLGETKEAKRMEFNLSVKKEESEAAGSASAPAEETEEEPVPEDVDE